MIVQLVAKCRKINPNMEEFVATTCLNTATNLDKTGGLIRAIKEYARMPKAIQYFNYISPHCKSPEIIEAFH